MKIKGFTIVPDYIVHKYTAVGAIIYGKIARYCEWSELNICTASNKRLAKELNLGESTIRKYKDLFAKDGLIIVTGKLGDTNTVSIPEEMVVEMYTPLPDSEGALPDSDPPLLLDSDKDTIVKDTLKDNYAKAIERGQRTAFQVYGDFEKYLGLSPNWDTKTNQAYYQFFRSRYEAGQTVKEFAKWWRADWKGKDGGFPSSLNQVQTLWLQAFTKSEDNYLEEQNRRLKELHG